MQHTQKRRHVGKHTTTDDPEAFRRVEGEAELRQRHYEVEIEPLAKQEMIRPGVF